MVREKEVLVADCVSAALGILISSTRRESRDEEGEDPVNDVLPLRDAAGDTCVVVREPPEGRLVCNERAPEEVQSSMRLVVRSLSP